MTEVPFDEWARFYDATIPSDRPDKPFFVEFCRDADGPVLELGCGTGDVYLDLLAAGVDAHGVDVSGRMLDALRRKGAERGLTPSVRRGDLSDPAFDRRFAAVIAPLNVVRYVTGLADQRRTFRTVFDSLDDGGRFAFWVDLPDVDDLCAWRDGATTRERFTHEGREYELSIRIELRDRVEQTVGYDFEYVDVGTGATAATMVFEMSLVPKRQFDLLLEEAGFAEWTWIDGLTRDPLSTPADPAVCVARR